MAVTVDQVDQIIKDAFYLGRMQRSDQYKSGMRAILEFWANVGRGEPQRYPACPHPIGTAEADAWFAGGSEGRLLSVDLMAGTAPVPGSRVSP